MNKMLMIIDAQYDFILGSMKSENAKNKMDGLAEYIKKNKDKYSVICFTADWHPINHSSFVQNGGEWPMHCVEYSLGASIYNPIMLSVIQNEIPFLVLTKGCNSVKEEYSILENSLSKEKLLSEISKRNIDSIDVCGIANEYCVLNTVKDLNEKRHLSNKLNILFKYVSAIKDDAPLKEYVERNNLKFE